MDMCILQLVETRGGPFQVTLETAGVNPRERDFLSAIPSTASTSL